MSNPEASPASAPSSDKRQPRQSRLVKAELACPRLGKFDVTIRNVSETGLGGQSPHTLNIGERMTIFLPGHEPMMGTVRWVVERKFGLQTDRPVETARLRTAHGGTPSTDHPTAGFEIIPPPMAPARRPGLVLGAAQPAHFGRSVWQGKRP